VGSEEGWRWNVSGESAVGGWVAGGKRGPLFTKAVVPILTRELAEARGKVTSSKRGKELSASLGLSFSRPVKEVGGKYSRDRKSELILCPRFG
jgi:hypothetical protein